MKHQPDEDSITCDYCHRTTLARTSSITEEELAICEDCSNSRASINEMREFDASVSSYPALSSDAASRRFRQTWKIGSPP